MRSQLIKQLSASVMVILIGSIAGMPAPGRNQHKVPPNERRLLVYGLIRQVQNRADGFEKVLKPSLRVSPFSRSERGRDLLDRADNIAFGSYEIRKHFEAGQAGDALRPEVGDLFVAAERINFVINNVDLGEPAVSSWSELRDALNNLGAVYGLKPLTTISYVSRNS